MKTVDVNDFKMGDLITCILFINNIVLILLNAEVFDFILNITIKFTPNFKIEDLPHYYLINLKSLFQIQKKKKCFYLIFPYTIDLINILP